MKNDWWEKKAESLQAADDINNMKTFHDVLRTIYGPKNNWVNSIRASDQTTLLIDKTCILACWAEHFNALLNRDSSISEEVIAALPQLPVKEPLADPPSSVGTTKALKQTTSGKAPGADRIPADIYQNGGKILLEKLTTLFQSICEMGEVPQDFKDASVAHIYKR
ncbi:hypothetical protein ACOMHN_041626 [Nucella lapillus]